MARHRRPERGGSSARGRPARNARSPRDRRTRRRPPVRAERRGRVAWTLVDRIALDADATALTWTDDGDTVVVATASGFVGAFEWRVAEGEAPTTIGQPMRAVVVDYGDGGATGRRRRFPLAEWRRRARAPVAQKFIAAGRDARAPFITAGGGTSAERSCGCPRRDRNERRDSRVQVADTPPGARRECRRSSGTVRRGLTARRRAHRRRRRRGEALDPNPERAVGGTTDDRAFFQALTIQTESGPATMARRTSCDLLAARWISTASGEYAAGSGGTASSGCGAASAWMEDSVTGRRARRGRPTLASGPRPDRGRKATSRG